MDTKVIARSPDGDTNFINIVTGVFQGDTLAQFLFIICLDYILQKFTDLMKENTKKGKMEMTSHGNYK